MPTELARKIAPDKGVLGLTPETRAHVMLIGTSYDHLGELIVHRAFDETLAIGGYGSNIVRLWGLVTPFAAERPGDETSLTDTSE